MIRLVNFILLAIFIFSGYVYPLNGFCLRIPIGMEEDIIKNASLKVEPAGYYAELIWDDKVEPVWGADTELGMMNEFKQMVSFSPAVYGSLCEMLRDNEIWLTDADKRRFYDERIKIFYIVDKAIWSYAVKKGVVKHGKLKELSFEFSNSEQETIKINERKTEAAIEFTKVVQSGEGKEDIENIKKFLDAALDIYKQMYFYYYRENLEDLSFLNPFFDTTPRYCYYSLGSIGAIDEIRRRRESITDVINGFYEIRRDNIDKAMQNFQKAFSQIWLSADEKELMIIEIANELARLELTGEEFFERSALLGEEYVRIKEEFDRIYKRNKLIKARFIDVFSKFEDKLSRLSPWMEKSETKITTLKGNEYFIAWVMVRHLILDNIYGLDNDVLAVKKNIGKGDLNSLEFKINLVRNKRLYGFSEKFSGYVEAFQEDEALTETMLRNLVFHANIANIEPQITSDFLSKLRIEIEEIVKIIQSEFPLDTMWENVVTHFRTYKACL